MRVTIILLALAGLSACNRNSAEAERPTIPLKSATISFEGADYKDDAAKLVHGERLTHILGCRGCHGGTLQGQRFYERYASNLTRELPKYSDAQIERLLRTGVPIDGREMWAMPSEIFQHVGAEDMTALIAYLRALHPVGTPTQRPLPWTQGSKDEIAKGNFKPTAVFVREQKSLTPVDLGPEYALGRYITTVTCAECHGPQLKGFENFSPDLIIAGGYTRDEFEQLITQGTPSGGRKLKNELMADVAKGRFSQLTPHERDALFAYLKARAERTE